MTVMPADSLIHMALLSSRRLAIQDRDKQGRYTWFGQLFTFLSRIGCHAFVYDGQANVFDLPKIMRVMRGACHDKFIGLPCPQEASSRLQLATYHHWFAGPLPENDADWSIAEYLRKCMKYKLITKLSRFRLGSHDLRIEIEKWSAKEVRVAVRSRYCLRCHRALVDDEYHAVFECSAFASHLSSNLSGL
jgi:hypothetical protein